MRKHLRSLLLLALLPVGCQRVNDTNRDNLDTRSNLNEWAHYVIILSDARIEGKQLDIGQFKTTDDVISKIHSSDFDFIKHDSWERPFDWSVRTEGERTIVRVSSWGRNGINENGEGDDLYVEVTIVKGREPQALLRTEKGEIHKHNRPDY